MGTGRETETNLTKKETTASQTETRSADASLKVIASPLRQLIAISATIFLTEATVMFLLARMPVSSVYENILLTSLLLAIVTLPILYFLIVRPLISHSNEFNRAEETLRQQGSFLESDNAEKALVESEEKYRSLIESSDDSIYLVDKNYRYLYMNEKHATRMGFLADDYIGREYGEFHTPEETEAFVGDVGKVLETGRSIRHEHRSKRDSRYFLLTLSPVRGGDGKPVAVTVVSKDISELKGMEEKLRTLSLTDELTGLYNRRGFFAMAEHILKVAKRQKKGVYMLYADLDKLKAINDTWGHQEGDLALMDTAHILEMTYRESDVIVRIGGDEFAVFPAGTVGDDIQSIVARLTKNIENHNATGKRSYKLSISCGISFFDPEEPCSLDELLAQGDKMMYRQKMLKRV